MKNDPLRYTSKFAQTMRLTAANLAPEFREMICELLIFENDRIGANYVIAKALKAGVKRTQYVFKCSVDVLCTA